MTTPTTRLISDPAELRDALIDIKPRFAAVAYVGRHWRDLLGAHGTLEEIVVSPTSGSNPWALEDLCNEIGWDNVHFLEKLHAKIYIGPRRVIVGSCNLSSNGFDMDGTGMFEAVVLSSETGLRHEAEAEFERLRGIAQGEYPTEARKKKRLKAMKAASEVMGDAQKKGQSVMDGASTLCGFHDYEVGQNRIFLEWSIYEENEGGEDDDIYYLDVLLRTGEDRARHGDWVLGWRATKKGDVHAKPTLWWMRIDDVRENVRDDPVYVDQVAQKRAVRAGLEPFEITPEFEEAFSKLMASYPDLRPNGSAAMKMHKLSAVDDFLEELKKVYDPPLI